jgi:hypothetical protein
MARDRVKPFIGMLRQAADQKSTEESLRMIIESLRVMGYVDEMEYSALNTELNRQVHAIPVRTDGSETIELARNAEEILPREY